MSISNKIVNFYNNTNDNSKIQLGLLVVFLPPVIFFLIVYYVCQFVIVYNVTSYMQQFSILYFHLSSTEQALISVRYLGPIAMMASVLLFYITLVALYHGYIKRYLRVKLSLDHFLLLFVFNAMLLSGGAIFLLMLWNIQLSVYVKAIYFGLFAILLLIPWLFSIAAIVKLKTSLFVVVSSIVGLLLLLGGIHASIGAIISSIF